MNHLFAKLILFPAFVLAAAQAGAQTGGTFGFEDNTVGGFTGTSSSETATVNSTAANVRTGTYSLKMTTTSTGTGNKQWYSVAPYAASSSPIYIHYIYWAKAQDAGLSMDASFRYLATAPPVGSGSSANAANSTAVSTTGWTRVTNNVNTGSIRYYYPGPRKVTSAGATSMYVDDGIIYTSTSSTTDTVAPMPPTALAGTVAGNLVTLSWTNGADTGVGATNVANTILLRAPAATTAIPTLNNQGVYSAAGGITGPNTVNGWTVVSTTTGAATTYLDAVTPPGNYIYAAIMQDSAYNYSPATISASVTVSNPIPVIFLNQAGFTGSLGAVVKNTTSAEMSYKVNGLNLSSGITITAPAGFEVSQTSGAGFAGSLTLAQMAGTVPATTIYVHYKPTAATGSSGTVNITNSSTGAATLNVPVTANAIETEPGSTGSISFGDVKAARIQVNLPTVGNGNRRIIVMKNGSDVSFTPADGVAPTGVNTDYSQATDQGSGDRIVYDGNGQGNAVVTVTGLTSSTTYYFAVYEYNVGTGTSQNYLPNSPVTAIARTADHDVSVGNGPTAASIKIFPNPTAGALFIDAPVAVGITIRDLAGRIVYHLAHARQADIHSLAPGIYMLAVADENGVLLKTEKLVKE